MRSKKRKEDAMKYSAGLATPPKISPAFAKRAPSSKREATYLSAEKSTSECRVRAQGKGTTPHEEGYRGAEAL